MRDFVFDIIISFRKIRIIKKRNVTISRVGIRMKSDKTNWPELNAEVFKRQHKAKRKSPTLRICPEYNLNTKKVSKRKEIIFKILSIVRDAPIDCPKSSNAKTDRRGS